MQMTRRQMLKLGGGTAALWAAGGLKVSAAAKKIPVGVQLYSVRSACEKDLPGALKAISGMGYQGVEFAGYYGRSAGELRKLLDDHGLKCCGTHTQLNTLQDDQLEATVAFNKTLGNPYLIVPGLPGANTESADAVKRTAEWFSATAAKVKPMGMYVGYHAHGGDFRKMEGDRTEWDILFQTSSKDVIMQLDTGNCLGGGGDPYAVLKAYPGRSKTIHIKPHGGQEIVGEDTVDWPRVLELCETVGGTEWYIVEQETAPDRFDNIRRCLENFRQIRK